MTPEEHYRAAEVLIEQSGDGDKFTLAQQGVLAAFAQVHATLAVAHRAYGPVVPDVTADVE